MSLPGSQARFCKLFPGRNPAMPPAPWYPDSMWSRPYWPCAQDELKFCGILLLAYPVAMIFHLLSPRLRNLLNILVSISILILFDLRDGFVHLFISIGGSLALARFVKGRAMPWIVLCFLICHFLVAQALVGDVPMDRNTSLAMHMGMIAKLSSLCWNIYDGRQIQNKGSKLSKYQKMKALPSIPAFFDLMGYLFYLPTLFVGYHVEYFDYSSWANDRSTKVWTSISETVHFMSSPILRGLQGIAWLAVFMFLAPRFPGQILLSPEFKQHGFCWSAFTAAMSAFTHRSKYYGIWCLIDGACALTGLRRADVEDKKGLTWKTIQNINPYRIESAQNIRGFLCHWNMGVSNWLRHYVYTRIAEDGTRPDAKSSLGTFMILASWHGFEPGYYVAFIGAATAQIMAKELRRGLRPKFKQLSGGKVTIKSKLYDLCGWLTTQATMIFIVVPYLLLDMEATLKVWSHVLPLLLPATFAIAVLVIIRAEAIRRQALRLKALGTSATWLYFRAKPSTFSSFPQGVVPGTGPSHDTLVAPYYGYPKQHA